MRSLLAVLVSPLVICLVPLPASALTFNLNFPAGATNPNDPTGAGLQSIAQEAADRWSDIILDSHTITLNVSYYVGDGPCGNKRGCAPLVTDNAAQNRTVEGDVFLNADRDWYIDPTPSSDSEFDMVQTAYNDLTPTQKTAGYSGSPLLEVGFGGSINFSDPNASNNFDMLSTFIHEIGHHLGVTNQLLAATNETLDGDYDLPPSLLGGRIMAVNSVPPNNFHFVDAFPLMSDTGLNKGIRNLPTAADVFAAAAVSNWTQIELKRKDFYGINTNFNNSVNWSGGRQPRPADFASIRHGGNVQLIANDVVGGFLLADASTLATGPNNLFVQGDALVGTTAGIGTAKLTVNNNGTFGGDTIRVDEGTIALAGGVLSAAQGSIDNDGKIEGNGSVRYDLSFLNNGTLSASGGTLIIEEAIAGSGAELDLDGSGGGVVEAQTGSLDVDVDLFGATFGPAFFSGTMTIGPGQFIEVNDPVRQQSGLITLDGNASQVAEYRGPELIIRSTVVADRLAAIDADVDLIGNGDVQVPQANDSLTFEQNLDLTGGNITGLGSVTVQGDLTAVSGSIDVGELNLDGDAQIQFASVEAELLNAPGTFDQAGGTLAFGKFTGKLGQNDGVIEIDQSILIGDILQGPQGELDFEISGATVFSQLQVSQTAELAGTVNVSLVGGYDPSGGEQFPIILAGSIDPSGLSLGGPDAGRFQLLLGGSQIILEALAPLLGDYNSNGIVDAADYTVWRDNLGSTIELAADGNDNLVIDQADYDVWKNNFGATTSTSVPEPSGLVVLMSLAGGMWAGRRHGVPKVKTTPSAARR